jgi:hypothetical protein
MKNLEVLFEVNLINSLELKGVLKELKGCCSVIFMIYNDYDNI